MKKNPSMCRKQELALATLPGNNPWRIQLQALLCRLLTGLKSTRTNIAEVPRAPSSTLIDSHVPIPAVHPDKADIASALHTA